MNLSMMNCILACSVLLSFEAFMYGSYLASYLACLFIYIKFNFFIMNKPEFYCIVLLFVIPCLDSGLVNVTWLNLWIFFSDA